MRSPTLASEKPKDRERPQECGLQIVTRGIDGGDIGAQIPSGGDQGACCARVSCRGFSGLLKTSSHPHRRPHRRLVHAPARNEGARRAPCSRESLPSEPRRDPADMWFRVGPKSLLALTVTATCLLMLLSLLLLVPGSRRTAAPLTLPARDPTDERTQAPPLARPAAPSEGAGGSRRAPSGPVHVEMTRAWESWNRRRSDGVGATPPRGQLLCALQGLVRRGTEVLRRHEAAGAPGRNALPAVSLARQLAGKWQRCAVVMNAGSLLRAQLGAEIDGHDAVMRFNSAPTAGYEIHVGTKTSIRLVNWQIVNQEKFNFETSELYRDIILVLWGPPPYTCTEKNQQQWKGHVNITFPALDAYMKRRRERPRQPFYLLHPCFRRGLWDLVQHNVGHGERILENPTSSGLLGVALMMSLCQEVTVYDFIPPRGRATRQCHYFEPTQNPECTLGSWHPLMQEKLLAMHLSNPPAQHALQSGRLAMPGLANLTCSARHE
ncbi:beta-galactoside alpha-2,6-sialyltransferase 1-like isoform X1 [Lethenteron reissneri]|uniref:beta-galactoside alpha-2,6-sialyltransferase 1-like isoform X1 n=3 Tax=Lethenteron reissneri TaxID=7753 RepID=UPI002AB5F02E|nr:beta-galactoside alpha-2,6-sialyltransferase 1-like isoform X1 [Lethenteron reissneri]